MRLLTKIINGPLKGQCLFALLDKPDFLFTFQEIPKWLSFFGKPNGFYIECYEQKFKGQRVGYIYAHIRGKTLEFNIKQLVLHGSFILDHLKNHSIRINKRQRRIMSEYALKISDLYAIENQDRLPSQKGFGKLLVRMAIEIALQQYHLKRLFIYCNQDSYQFYRHIFKMPPRQFQGPHPFIDIDLKQAWEAISGTSVPKDEPEVQL